MGTSNAYGLAPPLKRRLAFPLVRRLVQPPALRTAFAPAQGPVPALALWDTSVRP